MTLATSHLRRRFHAKAPAQRDHACTFFAGLGLAQTIEVVAAYNYPARPGTPTDSLLNGLASIRGCTFDEDVDGDGKAEIAVMNYNDNGHVHIFEVVGNYSLELVWTSPRVTPGGAQTPRFVAFGDLDGDTKKEIIFQISGAGILVFEWDGVTGSDTTGPSRLSRLPCRR